MSQRETIVIATAADGRYCRQLATMIAGLDRSASTQPYRLYVLYDGYDCDLMRRVSQSVRSNIELVWVDATSAKLKNALLPWYLPPSTLLRLLVAELLPERVKRLIYIDAD